MTFQHNDFANSHIQMTSSGESDDTPQKKLSWEGHSAYLQEDEAYYKAMIKRAHDLPQAVRLTIPRFWIFGRGDSCRPGSRGSGRKQRHWKLAHAV